MLAIRLTATELKSQLILFPGVIAGICFSSTFWKLAPLPRRRSARSRHSAKSANYIGIVTVAFVNLLLEVKQQQDYPIFVVLTMRSDFLGDCTQFPGLAEAINAGE